MIAEWTDEQREAIGRDGFLIVEEGFLDDDAVEALREVHPEHVDPVYSRYRRVDDMNLDESFFPIVWTRDGRRTAWLDELIAVDRGHPVGPTPR
jgi:hypothetical protein